MYRTFLFIAVCAHINAFACESGAFIGVGVGLSFDKDLTDISLETNVQISGQHNVVNNITANHSARKNAYCGCFIVGYEKVFDEKIHCALISELWVLSSANAMYNYRQGENIERYNISRDKIMPVFGLSIGRISGNWNIGIRGGVSFERLTYKVSGAGLFYSADQAPSKKLVSMSPYIGAYVERKFGTANIFVNVDYNIFRSYKLNNFNSRLGRSIRRNDEIINVNFANYSKHRRPSIRVSIGIKKRIQSLL